MIRLVQEGQHQQHKQSQQFDVRAHCDDCLALNICICILFFAFFPFPLLSFSSLIVIRFALRHSSYAAASAADASAGGDA